MALRTSHVLVSLLGMAALCGTLAAAYWLGARQSSDDELPIITEVEHPSVLLAVKQLSRLETGRYEFEKVVELRQDAKILWGLLHSQDAVLLIAAGKVVAGVDLKELNDDDMTVDWENKAVKIEIPPARIFDVSLDEKKTRVYERRTGVFSKYDTHLEADARKRALLEFERSALEQGILKNASESATVSLSALLKGLGFEIILINGVLIEGKPVQIEEAASSSLK